MNHKTLRKQYPEFVYESFDWKLLGDNLEIIYKFNASNAFYFSPKLIFKNVKTENIKNKRDFIDNLVFNIGMVEMLSYWKVFCSPKIIVQAGSLDRYQVVWWEKLLINGMGQYFYENEIDFTSNNFIEIKSTVSPCRVTPCNIEGKGILVPVGGGKDSSVTLELLSKYFNKVTGFVSNPTKSQIDTVKTAAVKHVEVERVIDGLLINLNKRGFLNGHTPYSAYLSFASVLAAVLGGNKYIVFSNEASSDEENVTYLKHKINHQYSKSFEFENDFREYNKKYLSDVNYFSFLRPIYDIQIAEIFSDLPKYYKVIRSCNVGQKTDTWCGKCPKCLSTYILFNKFMPKETKEIFGKDLLKDNDLKQILNDLINEDKVKPFECVGTRHELRVALGLKRDDKLMKFWGGNNLPSEFKLLLYINLMFKDKKLLILGYGREGKSTEKLIKKYLPEQKYDIGDQNLSKNYLKQLNNYDFIFKSPGIPNKLPEIKQAKKKGVIFTSQTQIFLKLFREYIVGITGTKGKSTTVSLLTHVLKENNFDCELVGNIGKPVFDFLENADSNKIYVAEFSSHQLADVDFSPRTAVYLNIFPEHLDYYESYKDYKKAKENIYKYQKEGDLYISEEDINKFNFPEVNSQLIGEHNKNNIKAVFLVAKLFEISDKRIIDAIKTFKPLEDRLEIVRKVDGITFINDGLATIPEATLAAIDAFEDKKLTLILGGFDRGLSFANFGKELSKRKNIINVILIGQTADKIKHSIKVSRIKIYDLGFGSMNKIVKKAFGITKTNGYVLLSPAATSFDMFKDYRDRDEQFKKEVYKL